MVIEYGLRSLLTSLFRQKFKFLLVFLLISITGFIYLKNLESPYQAYGSFLVKFGQGALPDMINPGQSNVTQYSENDRDEILQSYVKLLYSTNLLNEVVETYGATNIYPNIENSLMPGQTAHSAAVQRLQHSNLKVYADLDSNVIELFLRNDTPETARDVAQLVMDSFVKKQLEIFNAPQSNFLGQQITEAETALKKAQTEFQRFKTEAGISDLNKEMERLIIEKGELSTVALQAVNDAQAKLDALENELAQKQTTYKPESQALKRLRTSVGVARSQLKKRQDDLNAIGQKGSSMSAKIDAIDARIAYLEDHRSSYDEHDQTVTLAKENHQFFQKQNEQARLHDVLAQQNFSRIVAVDEPTIPEEPMSQNKKLLFLAVLMAAGIVGTGVIIIFEVIDESISDPRQIQKAVGLPVITTFSSSETKGQMT